MSFSFGLQTTALAALLALGTTPSASTVPISGRGTLGSFTESLTYSPTTSLTSTSPVANSGFITTFVLNNPGNQITSISSFTDAPGGGCFSLIALTNNGVNASPNGQFDFGATTGGSFEGGGSPNPGIAVGASDSFAFSLTGSNLSALTASSFLTEISTGTGSGAGAAALDVRFRGFTYDGSDKVVFGGGAGGDAASGTPVPEPASMVLLRSAWLGSLPGELTLARLNSNEGKDDSA